MPHDAAALVDDLTPDFVRLQSVMDRAAEVTARHAVKHAQRYLYHTHQKGDATLSKITARFDGRECKFHIARNHIPYLEASLGRGLYDVLRDFTDGKWTFRDVAMVVSFALHGPDEVDKVAITSGLQAIRLRLPLSAVGTASGFGPASHRPSADVVAILERDGHGNYASLAADILTYTIFGETDADEAA